MELKVFPSVNSEDFYYLFFFGEEDGMYVSSVLGQHVAVTDGLGQLHCRQRHHF